VLSLLVLPLLLAACVLLLLMLKVANG